MNDKNPGARQCHEKHAPTYWKGVVREYKDALDKAEQERDEARATMEEYRSLATRYAAESRPLTPDAITDEMVERARREADGWGRQVSDVGMCRILAAALTEPPARPEGAEDIEAAIRQVLPSHSEDRYAYLADKLAERGVRVVAEEMNR